MCKNIYGNIEFPRDAIFNLQAVTDLNLPQRVIKSLEVVKPDNILIIDNKPIVLFFDQDNALLHNSDGKKQIFKNCWNFSEAPIVIIETENDIEIYNGFDFIIKTKELQKLKKENFNYVSILSGDYFKYFNDVKQKKQNKKVDTFLLENIKDARETLLRQGLESHKNIANSLIGRIIFIRYLIDKKVSLNFQEPLNDNEDLKNILKDKVKSYKLFEYLKNSFNGDWFPIIKDEKNNIFEESIVQQEHLQVLVELISGTKMSSGQRSLFDIYDFSIIPIEFISNVYESFIGEDEQRKSGAYYTPTFLVDYILKYTVDDFFKKNPDTYNCKVLDPACGSGIFLVETLRKLVAQFEKIEQRSIEQNELKKLVKDNIFGIDKDENAVLISIFSLYLTMLDYQDPKELNKFKFPNLLASESNQHPNFFNNDFFDLDAPYNDVLKNKKLDFIIGNPPYGGSTIKKNSPVYKYIKTNSILVGNEDIVQPFMIRVKDFVTLNTKISYIVTSKVLYNQGTQKFREKNFFNTFQVSHILELSSIRREIFPSADVPVSIIFYNHASQTDREKNIIKYISVKPNPHFKRLKILTISKSDYKRVSQSKLLNNDFLWKILVYGSYLDFNFLQRIKSKQYKKIQDLVDDDTIIKYQGFKRKDGNKKINVIELKDFDFIDTRPSRKDLKPFYIVQNLNNFKDENGENVGYINKQLSDDYTDLYKPPLLLFTGGLDKNLKQNSAMCYKKAVFTSSVVALKSFDNNSDILKNINGLFYSTFFSYYLLQTASSTGVRQEECDDYEKLQVPYIQNQNIISIVSEIENLKKAYLDNNEIQNPYEYERNLNLLIKQLDTTVLESFNLNKEELALVNYANDIIIPWVIQKKYDVAFKKLDYQDDLLTRYINIFTDHYSKVYQQSKMYFQANVFYDAYAIGIYFKVLKQEPKEIITWKKEENIRNFPKISGQHLLEQLFIQKDIKGFENDGFYVVKPNEYKNWHSAIGYLDFYEFNDAILKAGKNNWMN